MDVMVIEWMAVEQMYYFEVVCKVVEQMQIDDCLVGGWLSTFFSSFLFVLVFLLMNPILVELL